MKKLPEWVRIAETVDGTWMVLSHGFQVGGNVDSSGAGDRVFPTRAEAVRYAEAYSEEIRASAKGGVA